MLTESLTSTANKKKRASSITQNLKESEASAISSINQYAQETSVLEPSFLKNFKTVDRGKEIIKRNLAKGLNKTIAATDQETIRKEMIRANTKTPVVKEVSN